MHDRTQAQHLTTLLARWRDGDARALDDITANIYPLLRAMAQREMQAAGERLTLQATELAHEACMRLLQQRATWHNRDHLMAIVARTLRRVVVDLLRQRMASKRGPDRIEVTLGAVDAASPAETGVDWLALDEALNSLQRRDPEAARIVELRYFGGMNNDEIADVLGVGVATVVRRWQFARAWLHSRL